VDNTCRWSPVFREKAWHRLTIKEATRGPVVWEVKAARVHLVDTSWPGAVSLPTDRQYWLIVARNPRTDEIKYFDSNAPGGARLTELVTVALGRWHVEKWFERAKQEACFGALEVGTYTSLIRHWRCLRMVMYFLAAQTQRLRGEKSADHAGAGGPGSEHAGVENLEPFAALVG